MAIFFYWVYVFVFESIYIELRKIRPLRVSVLCSLLSFQGLFILSLTKKMRHISSSYVRLSDLSDRKHSEMAYMLFFIAAIF